MTEMVKIEVEKVQFIKNIATVNYLVCGNMAQQSGVANTSLNKRNIS